MLLFVPRFKRESKSGYYVYFRTSAVRLSLAGTAAQLFAAADRVPFAGSGLPPLVLRRFRCQFGRHVEARGRLSERTLARLNARAVRFGTSLASTHEEVPILRPHIATCPLDEPPPRS